MLSLLSESPTSQLFKLLLSFVPSILTTIVGVMLTKKLGQEKRPNTSTKTLGIKQNTTAEEGDIKSDIELNSIENGINRAKEEGDQHQTQEQV